MFALARPLHGGTGVQQLNILSAVFSLGVPLKIPVETACNPEDKVFLWALQLTTPLQNSYRSSKRTIVEIDLSQRGADTGADQYVSCRTLHAQHGLSARALSFPLFFSLGVCP